MALRGSNAQGKIKLPLFVESIPVAKDAATGANRDSGIVLANAMMVALMALKVKLAWLSMMAAQAGGTGRSFVVVMHRCALDFPAMPYSNGIAEGSTVAVYLMVAQTSLRLMR